MAATSGLSCLVCCSLPGADAEEQRHQPHRPVWCGVLLGACIIPLSSSVTCHAGAPSRLWAVVPARLCQPALQQAAEQPEDAWLSACCLTPGNSRTIILASHSLSLYHHTLPLSVPPAACKPTRKTLNPKPWFWRRRCTWWQTMLRLLASTTTTSSTSGSPVRMATLPSQRTRQGSLLDAALRSPFT